MLGLSCSARLARRGSRAVRESWHIGMISWRGQQCRDGGLCPLGIRRQFHGSQVVGDKVVVPLPGLGDSITEGAIVTWEKSVGESVNVDDVLLVVDTDKISIDIRSPHSGVLVKQHVAVDDNVEVGASLCTIDSVATGEVIKSSNLDEDAEIEPGQPTPPPTVEDDAGFAAFSSGGDIAEPPRQYVPLIKFLGKRKEGATKKVRKMGHTPEALNIDQVVGGAMYGRPHITQEEIDAVNSGGAESAPLGKVRNIWTSE